MNIMKKESDNLEHELKHQLYNNEHITIHHGTQNEKVTINNDNGNEINVDFPFVEVINKKSPHNGFRKISTTLIPIDEITVVRCFKREECEE